MKTSAKLFYTALGIALVMLAQLQLVDNAGLRHTEEGLSRALVTYGIVRGLNGVISVVQGTEVAIEPVGVGMTFTPGQILDPVNDLIEQFSSIVLVSGIAFGIQRVFLDIVSTPICTIALALAALCALLLMWFGKGSAVKLQSPVYRAVIILLIIRFSIPGVAIMSETFYQHFLAPQFQASSQQLLTTTDQLKDIQAKSEGSMQGAIEPGKDDKGFLESAKEFVRSATQSLDVRRHLDDFKAAAENISEHAIKLIVVFIVQTLILPLGSLWLILQSIRWVAVRDSSR